MTGHTTLARLPGPGALRMLLVFLFVLTGLALLGFVMASVMRFTLPQVVLTEVGPVEDFPLSDKPYEIHTDEGMFFLVNTGEELIAHHPVYPRRPSCAIRWRSEERRFIDPCSGTQFWLNGSYISGPPASMQRYALVVEEGVVRVDLSRVMPGPVLVRPEE